MIFDTLILDIISRYSRPKDICTLRLVFYGHPINIMEGLDRIKLLSEYGIYRMIHRKYRRLPEVAIHNPEWACKLAIIRGSRWHEAEKCIFKSPEYGYKYLREFKMGKKKSFESVLFTSPKWTYKYAKNVLKRELNICGKKSIARDPKWSYKYTSSGFRNNYTSDSMIKHPKWAYYTYKEFGMDGVYNSNSSVMLHYISKSPHYSYEYMIKEEIDITVGNIDLFYGNNRILLEIFTTNINGLAEWPVNQKCERLLIHILEYLSGKQICLNRAIFRMETMLRSSKCTILNCISPSNAYNYLVYNSDSKIKAIYDKLLESPKLTYKYATMIHDGIWGDACAALRGHKKYGKLYSDYIVKYLIGETAMGETASPPIPPSFIG
jgi:hypothetical protein